jgi:hypothetical protein
LFLPAQAADKPDGEEKPGKAVANAWTANAAIAVS